MARQRNRQDATRRMVALEAARMITEQGMQDYHQAKTKAARRLGLNPESGLPRNTEVEAALREMQQLFGGEDRAQHLKALREAALEAMEHFSDFRPRLVGPVLDGTADQHSVIHLHVFAESPEQFALHLADEQIPHDQVERQIRMERQRQIQAPTFQFNAGGHPFDITVLPFKALRQPPLSAVTGRPIQRASIRALRDLLAAPLPQPAF